MFAFIDGGGTIRDLSLRSLIIRNYQVGGSGGLVGVNFGTLIRDHVDGLIHVTGSQYNLGGLTGWNNGTVSDSSADGKIISSGENRANTGGLVGYNTGAIVRSHATNFVDLGKIFGGDWQAAGGLVGYNDQNGTVDESFATGSVLGAQNNIGTSTGGLIGWALFGTVRDSYAMGSEANANWSGGFIGISDGSNYTSYSIGAPTGRYFTGGF